MINCPSDDHVDRGTVPSSLTLLISQIQVPESEGQSVENGRGSLCVKRRVYSRSNLDSLSIRLFRAAGIFCREAYQLTPR